MKVGFITPEYPHPKVSHAAGIGTSIKNLVDELVKKGIKVILFVYHQNENDVIQENGIQIHLIAKKRYSFSTWYFYRKHLNKYIINIVNEDDIKILEAPDWTGVTAFMKFKIPLIIRLHGSDAYFCKLENRKQKFKNFVFEKLALKSAQAYIAPTAFAGKVTQKIFKLNKDKIKTIHYGLKLNDFENDKPERFEKHTILYIGTLIRKKGVLELAQIFNKVIEKVPDSKLTLIGSDSQDIKTGNASTYSMVKDLLSDEAKKRCAYLGKIPYSQVQAHIKNSHVCVFPSYAETLGMVTIESMAMQKTVVNTNIGWAPEIIDDGKDGYLIHPSNIEEYTKRILYLFNNKKKIAEIGKSARDKVEKRFDIDKNAEININFYKKILHDYTCS